MKKCTNEQTKSYSDGLKDAWDAAYRISMMTNEEKYHVFGVSPRDNVFECYSVAYVLEVLEMKDAAREARISRRMLEKYMHDHGITNVDLEYPVGGNVMLDIVNSLLADLVDLGTLDDVMKQME